MRDYVIMTDSSCDLTAEMADELGLSVVPLALTLNGKQYLNYLDGREMDPKTLYARLREGQAATTSAANISQFTTAMEPILQQGKDILYLGFSSGLSVTYNASCVAAEEMQKRYPEAEVLTVDTLCASLGQGLLVYLAAQEKAKGKSIREVRDFAEDTKLHLCHWFTVDDLSFLKRGGRISAATAFVGTVLSIKPVMHMDYEGHLINIEKVRGRRNSIKGLLRRMQELATNPAEQTVFISHGDCEEEALYLKDLVMSELGVKKVFINYVGPVIGAHSGPGTLALFFLGTTR